MSETVDVSQQCAFPSAIDVTAVLDRLEIQFLDVHERRVIVIFAGAILNLECQEGELTALERAEITVYDLPVNSGSTSESEYDTAMELIDDFVDQLHTTSQSM
ncbi:hypothetical protein [Haloterrigena salinisoli]|uniref:hypothetical protein n=1 Tax=Haloterrigena salinisoli TaxID=3132747 RepID=UPI0030D517A5